MQYDQACHVSRKPHRFLKKGFKSLLKLFLLMFDAKLDVETIEGDEIYR
ncbi:hypothetical protein [Paenibacillus tianmuensis]|nr:hypothetical protein [Paenibacillus tianmuensis]